MVTRAPAASLSGAASRWVSAHLRDALLVLSAGTLMGVFARVAVPLPFTPVPVTGQTLGVLLLAALLGRRRGPLAMLVYLSEAMVGLPVFAGGTHAWSPSSAGVPVIVGPTAGYLFSFPVAAFLVGALAERGWTRSYWRAAVAMATGTACIYAGGVVWLAGFTGWERALPLGVIPFLPGDAVKVLIGAAVLPSGIRLLAAARLASPEA